MQRFTAAVAGHDRCGEFAAHGVAQCADGGLIVEVLFGPLGQGQQCGDDLTCVIGEVVLVPVRLDAVALLDDHACVDERGESCGEDVGGDAECALELPETPGAKEDFPGDQVIPAFAEQGDRGSAGIIAGGRAVFGHGGQR